MKATFTHPCETKTKRITAFLLGYLPASIARLPISSPTSNICSSMSVSNIYIYIYSLSLVLFRRSLVETTRSEIRQLSSEQRKGTLTMRIDLKLTLSRWTPTSRGDKREQWQQMCVYTVVRPWPILIRYRRCWTMSSKTLKQLALIIKDNDREREGNAIIVVFFHYLELMTNLTW